MTGTAAQPSKEEIRNETLKCQGCKKSDCFGCPTYNFLSGLDSSTGDE